MSIRATLKQNPPIFHIPLGLIYIGSMISVIFAPQFFSTFPKHSSRPSGNDIPWIAFFILAPPVWFFVEMLVYGKGHGHDEDFKHSQEIASRIWAACSVLLAIYWFDK